jgi:hypothetical protein
MEKTKIEETLKSKAEEVGVDVGSFTATFKEKLEKLKAAGTQPGTYHGKFLTLEDMAISQTKLSIEGKNEKANGSAIDVIYYLYGQGEVTKSVKDTPYRSMYALCQIDSKSKSLFSKINQENNLAFITAKIWSSAMFKPGFYTAKCKRGQYKGYPTFGLNDISVTDKRFDITKGSNILPFKKFKVLSSYPAQIVKYGSDKNRHLKGDEVIKENGEPLRSRNITLLTQTSDGKQEIVRLNTNNEKWLDLEIDPNQVYQGMITAKGEYLNLVTPPMKAAGKIELNMDVKVPTIAEFTGLEDHVGKMVLLSPAFGGEEISLNDKDGKITAFSLVSDINGNTFKLSAFNPTLFDNVKTEDECLPGIMKILVNIFEKDGIIRGTVLAIKDVSSEVPATEDFQIDEGEGSSSEKPSSKKEVPAVEDKW